MNESGQCAQPIESLQHANGVPPGEVADISEHLHFLIRRISKGGSVKHVHEFVSKHRGNRYRMNFASGGASWKRKTGLRKSARKLARRWAGPTAKHASRR